MSTSRSGALPAQVSVQAEGHRGPNQLSVAVPVARLDHGAIDRARQQVGACRRVGFQLMQGFYFGRPVASTSFASYAALELSRS